MFFYCEDIFACYASYKSCAFNFEYLGKVCFRNFYKEITYSVCKKICCLKTLIECNSQLITK